MEEKMEMKIQKISERINGRAKYVNCLLPHREEVLKAMFERDLCALWAILDECKIPCKERWDIVKFIMQKAEDTEGPQFW
jgi:hypothetical protein